MNNTIGRNVITTLAAVGCMAYTGSAHANNWVGASNPGNWGTAGNWTSSARVPISTDSANFSDTASSFSIDLGGVVRSFAAFTISGTSSYTFSNGTLEFTSMAVSGTAHHTINANINLAGDRTITSNSIGGLTSIYGALSGANRLTITSGVNNTTVALYGDNSGFSGGISVTNLARLALGSDTALGSGTLIINTRANNANIANSGLVSTGTTARNIANSVVIQSATSTTLFTGIGNSTNNGKLTFSGPIALIGGSANALVALHALSDFEFSGNISDTVDTPPAMLVFSGSTGSVITMSGTNSTYSGGTRIGGRTSGGNDVTTVRVTTDKGLGTGAVEIASGSNSLRLTNGITLANRILITSIVDNFDLIVSESGNNVLSGTLALQSAPYIPRIRVDEGTLTVTKVESMVRVSNGSNSVRKTGEGTLIYGSDHLVSGTFATQYINDGAVRGVSGVTSIYFDGDAASNSVIEGNGTMTRSVATTTTGNYIRWSSAASGGFAAHGGTFNIQLNGNTNAVTWGSGNFLSNGALIFGSKLADNTVDFQNALNLGASGTAATREIRVLDNTDSRDDYARISGVISGAADKTLEKTGKGRLELTATNTYSGSTLLLDGMLVLSGNGSINSSALTINGGEFRNNSSVNYTGALTFTSGTLGGTNWKGGLGGQIIGAGKVISPGNSPGTAETTSQTWAGGGTYLWEINNATGVAGAGSGWDLITGTGVLNITATGDSKFTILVTSLTLGNEAGDAVNFNDLAYYKWLIADFGSEIAFDADAFDINIDAFTNLFTGTLSIARGDQFGLGGDNTQLYLYIIPEPSTVGLMMGASTIGMMYLRRRRRNG